MRFDVTGIVSKIFVRGRYEVALTDDAASQQGCAIRTDKVGLHGEHVLTEQAHFALGTIIV